MRPGTSRILILLALLCGTGCVTAEMKREGIPARKSVILGETLAIFPGIIFHGIGHHYAGDHEGGSDLMGKEWKSLAYPIAWPFLAAASLASPENASLAATLDEATGITMAAPIYFLGTWIYDILNTPALIRAHNRMVDRMWEVKEVMDGTSFPRDIRLGSIRPGE
ncbi:MAG: hypothetical protein O6952_09140, partial [Planctomycetota bacterium]|nr:hypothetical protein [Planctomycetota bacterium]